MTTKVHISADGEQAHRGVKRQLGKTNIGLYCVKCDEFFALAVHNRAPGKVEFISDGHPLFECPMCGHRQRRQVSEIAEILLTEKSKQKPSGPAGLH